MRPLLAGIVRSLLLLAIVVAGVGRADPTRAQTPPADQVSGLSLAYLDSSKPDATEVWVSSLDSAAKRMVASFPHNTRAFGLEGSRIGLFSDLDLIVLDLADGSTQRTRLTNSYSHGYMAADGTAYFATYVGCGSEGSRQTILGRIDPATGERTDITQLRYSGAQILWHSPAANELIISPTGCDPGIGLIQRLDAQTGAEKARTDVRGCGWAAIDPSGRQTLVGTAFCAGIGADVGLYDLQAGGRRDFSFNKGESSDHGFVYAPDGSLIAYGTGLGRNQSGETTTSGGVWLLHPDTLRSTLLWQDPGLEAWAIDWSPDESRLVVASVQEQKEYDKQCGYYVIDVAAKSAAKVDLTSACGGFEGIVGFATLP
jgi:hypothetical protein